MNSQDPSETDQNLDARGLMCPEPVRLAALRIALLPEGAELCVLADDPAAPIDFEVWCLRQGHAFLACTEVGQGWAIRLRKGPAQPVSHSSPGSS